MQWTLSGQSVAAAKRTCGVCATEGLQNTATSSSANVPAIGVPSRPVMPGTLCLGNPGGQGGRARLRCDPYQPDGRPMPGSTHTAAWRGSAQATDSLRPGAVMSAGLLP